MIGKIERGNSGVGMWSSVRSENAACGCELVAAGRSSLQLSSALLLFGVAAAHSAGPKHPHGGQERSALEQRQRRQ